MYLTWSQGGSVKKYMYLTWSQGGLSKDIHVFNMVSRRFSKDIHVFNCICKVSLKSTTEKINHKRKACIIHVH